MLKYFQVLVFILLPLYVSAAPYSGHLGINISLPEQGGTFVDIIKENYRWTNPSSGQELGSTQVDEKGWPLCDASLVLDYRPVAEWSNSIDDPDGYRIDRSGTYSCSFKGTGQVISRNDGRVTRLGYNSKTGVTTFDFIVNGPPAAGQYLFVLEFKNAKRPSGEAGFTEFKMIRPGYPADSKQLFTDAFIKTLTSADFAAIRFMPFTGTNASVPVYPGVTEWQNRKLPGDASQTAIPSIGKMDGACWEYVIRLANRAKMDIWINIQVSATTDYVTRLATMLRDSLDSRLNIYVESSNEVWNTAPGFEQSTYNQAQAKALKIDEHQNHARRTIELAHIFEGVFGTGSLNNRVRVILCSHAPMLKWWMEPMLRYIEQKSGAPKNYLYAIACQTYFGGGAESGESVAKILADCRQNISNQVNETVGNQAGRKQWIQMAKTWGLPGGFCSYEGGPDHGGGSTDNVANRIRAERDMGMADVLKYNYADCFSDLGGNLAMQFTLSSAFSRYGCWGLTDDINNPDRNNKFQAVRDLIGVRTDSSDDGDGVPADFRLQQNYPNPFNSMTRISFDLPRNTHVVLQVYDIQGRMVAELVDADEKAGRHEVQFHAAGLASGLLVVQLQAGSFTATKKILLLK
jgi:hypothetical protein